MFWGRDRQLPFAVGVCGSFLIGVAAVVLADAGSEFLAGRFGPGADTLIGQGSSPCTSTPIHIDLITGFMSSPTPVAQVWLRQARRLSPVNCSICECRRNLSGLHAVARVCGSGLAQRTAPRAIRHVCHPAPSRSDEGARSPPQRSL